MKKFLSLLAATSMVFSLVLPVHANEPSTKLEDLIAVAITNAEANNETLATVTLTEDVTWTTGAGHGSTPMLNEGTVKELIIDGADEYTITAIGQGVGSIRAVGEDATLKFKNVAIDDESVSYAESSWEFTYLEFAGNLEFNNVDFLSGIQLDADNGSAHGVTAKFTDCTFLSENSSEYSVWVGNGNVTFEKCTFTGTRGLKLHEDYGSDIGTVVIEECQFIGISNKPGIAIGDLNADTTITLNSNLFKSCQSGDQKLYAYETDTDVTTFNFVYSEDNTVVNDPKVTIIDAYTTTDRIYVDLADIWFNESVELKLYSNDTLLTSTKLKTDEYLKPGAHSELTGSIKYEGSSSYWPQEPDWTPVAHLMPTKVEVYIDGEYMGDTPVYKTQNTNDFAGEELTQEDWCSYENVIGGTIAASLLKEYSEKAGITTTLVNVNAKESIVVEVYSGETKIATTTFKGDKNLLSANELTCQTYTVGTSSSWDTVWHSNASEDLVPTEVVLTIDGIEMSKHEVLNDLGSEIYEEVNTENWAAFPGTNHVVVIKDAKDATCEEKGYTGDEYCEVCDELLNKGTEIPATGHTEVVTPAVDPTCTEKGHTAVVTCGTCKEVLDAGEEIEALGHSEGCPHDATGSVPGTPEPDEETETPDTSDNSFVYLFGLMTVLATAILVVLKKKTALVK